MSRQKIIGAVFKEICCRKDKLGFSFRQLGSFWEVLWGRNSWKVWIWFSFFDRGH